MKGSDATFDPEEHGQEGMNTHSLKFEIDMGADEVKPFRQFLAHQLRHYLHHAVADVPHLHIAPV